MGESAVQEAFSDDAVRAILQAAVGEGPAAPRVGNDLVRKYGVPFWLDAIFYEYDRKTTEGHVVLRARQTTLKNIARNGNAILKSLRTEVHTGTASNSSPSRGSDRLRELETALQLDVGSKAPATVSVAMDVFRARREGRGDNAGDLRIYIEAKRAANAFLEQIVGQLQTLTAAADAALETAKEWPRDPEKKTKEYVSDFYLCQRLANVYRAVRREVDPDAAPGAEEPHAYAHPEDRKRIGPRTCFEAFILEYYSALRKIVPAAEVSVWFLRENLPGIREIGARKTKKRRRPARRRPRR